jgi:hypothetical protein
MNYGHNCGMTDQEKANLTVQYVQHVRVLSPHARVGEIEPYPKFGPQQILGWAQVLQAWAPIDFFHLDIDQNQIRNEAQFHADLCAIRDGLAELGVPFGVILHPNRYPVATDEDYRAGVLALWERVRAALGESPPHVIVQSWQPGGTMPQTLPESAPSSLTGILRTVVNE